MNVIKRVYKKAKLVDEMIDLKSEAEDAYKGSVYWKGRNEFLFGVYRGKYVTYKCMLYDRDYKFKHL